MAKSTPLEPLERLSSLWMKLVAMEVVDISRSEVAFGSIVVDDKPLNMSERSYSDGAMPGKGG